MNVTRITEFRAKDEASSGDLKHLVSKGVEIFEASEGCHSCQLLHDRNDPKTVLVIEAWGNIDARQLAAKSIPADDVEKITAIIDEPPKGRDFVA